MFGDIQLSTMGIFHRLQWFRTKNDVAVYLQKYIVIYFEYFSQIREVQGQKRRSCMFGIIQLSTLSNFHSLERFRAKNDVVIYMFCMFAKIYTYLLSVFFIDQRGSGPKATQSYVWKYIVIYSEYFSQIREVQAQEQRSHMFGNVQLSTLNIFHILERLRAKHNIVICLQIYSYLL